MDDLVKEFLVESYENLDRLDRDFVALETDPTGAEKLASIFRTIHTIKGTCGCLGFGKLEAVAHVGENLLSRLRDGQLVMDTEMTTGLLKLVDAVREILQNIERTEAEGNTDHSAVCQTLVKLNARPSIGQAAHGAPADSPAEHPPECPSDVPAIAPVANAPKAREAQAPVAPAAIAAHESAEPTHEAATETGGKEKPADSLAGNAIRVDVVLLDKLMNLVGELVLARNQVLQYTSSAMDPSFLRTAQRLNLITSELQEGVMKTRMQPIGNLWNKFPRIVRDVANACNKKVRIEMEGRETELDKTILEAIKDPLTHVIRNSVDHGVESPEKRLSLSKPEEGRLFMRAFHEGGQVNIEISDDGKGIDTEAVKRKAVERGLITPEHAARMGEREATNLVFLPGFSTAEKITNVSGRGVGMDVVKTNVEKIGGTVDIQSKVGDGTTLRIKIPLTLAIIPALIVTTGGERFAIPQVSLLELVRVDDAGTGGEGGIEMIHGTPLYRLRGNLLPLIYLNKELKLPLAAGSDDLGRASNIVVLRGGDRQFGLVVDQINDTEEIVVRPLGKQLKGIGLLAGATIMGDGKVALILDVSGLAHRANVISHAGDAATRAGAAQAKLGATDHQSLLLCVLPGGHRVAIPLSQVARLEEFPTGLLEDAGGMPVVQYRGQIMPLVDVAAALGCGGQPDEPEGDATKIQVVVHTRGGNNVGLRVQRILDVVEERVVVRRTSVRHGVLGTAVIKEKVTELLDVAAVTEGMLPFELEEPREAA